MKVKILLNFLTLQEAQMILFMIGSRKILSMNKLGIFKNIFSIY